MPQIYLFRFYLFGSILHASPLYLCLIIAIFLHTHTPFFLAIYRLQRFAPETADCCWEYRRVRGCWLSCLLSSCSLTYCPLSLIALALIAHLHLLPTFTYCSCIHSALHISSFGLLSTYPSSCCNKEISFDIAFDVCMLFFSFLFFIHIIPIT